jgi:hypothetical protein
MRGTATNIPNTKDHRWIPTIPALCAYSCHFRQRFLTVPVGFVTGFTHRMNRKQFSVTLEPRPDSFHLSLLSTLNHHAMNPGYLARKNIHEGVLEDYTQHGKREQEDPALCPVMVTI